MIRLYSSSPPPMEDAGDDDDNEFGDFGTFAGLPSGVSFSEFATPNTFDQSRAPAATSPPEILHGRGAAPCGRRSSDGARGDLSKPERTETKKVVLTNGFAPSDAQGSPLPRDSVHARLNGPSTEDTGAAPEDDFADFAAFSNAEGNPAAEGDPDDPVAAEEEEERETPSEDDGGDAHRTGPGESESVPEAPGGDTDRGSLAEAEPQRRRDEADAPERSAPEAVCSRGPLAENGAEDDSNGAAGSPDADGEAGPSGGSGDEAETAPGRPLSPDALEELGEASATGPVPSPPPRGETAAPADRSQEDDDEDFGDFGDAGSFADFDQPDVQQEPSEPDVPAAATRETTDGKDEDDFGDFNSPKCHGGENEGGGGTFADFPVSDSFGNFNSAADGEADAGWSAFGEQQVDEEDEEEKEEEQLTEGEESWAAFGSDQSAAPPERGEEEEEEDEGERPALGEESSRTDSQSAPLSLRLEKLFQGSFPQTSAPPQEDQVESLRVLVGRPEDQPQPGADEEKKTTLPSNGYKPAWLHLRDIHESVGLRYQWGGSYCNKALLCCLGIDTRNILFTGQKKQPVIVPMYAASLGMLEPTKEPVKPVSAAEVIASIAQTAPAAPQTGPCPSDPVQQEALPPVQFDWSSSGLTNPLDVSGGSSLLNLDFFGPVEDSGSSSSPPIPGVDPELYELTTAKMESGGGRVVDAFARLMSTMEKTSTSTRKPRREEHLSGEASAVIARLPDLSFMQATGLMFPATLTPLSCRATPD